MTGFWTLDYLCLAAILAAAFVVLLVPNLSGAVMALSAVGTTLSLLFVVLSAPDVALPEVVVGAIALPALYLVAIGKVRAAVHDPGDLGEDEDTHADRSDSDDGEQRR